MVKSREVAKHRRVQPGNILSRRDFESSKRTVWEETEANRVREEQNLRHRRLERLEREWFFERAKLAAAGILGEEYQRARENYYRRRREILNSVSIT